jgi:hypothetical protein
MSYPGLSPVGIGGIGGSGTRVIADFIRFMGYYIGDELSDALDNLWFTLLFKRRLVLGEDLNTLSTLFEIFRTRMQRVSKFSEDQCYLIQQLAVDERPQHTAQSLTEWAASLLEEGKPLDGGQPWGWKEPNTHVVIDRLLEIVPQLRYLHVIRDPFYLAHSQNQNQLETWGALYLDREVSIGPRDAVSYSCAVHRRIADLVERWPDQVMLVDYDDLCRSPITAGSRISRFLNAPSPPSVLLEFAKTIRPPPSTKAVETVDFDDFDPEDLAYIASLGYGTPRKG